MTRVPDVLLIGCGEEDEAEAPWRNETLQISLYDSAQYLGPFSAFKTTRTEVTAAPLPDLELLRWKGPSQGSRTFADVDLLEMLHHNLVEEELAPFAKAALVSGARTVEYRFDPPPKTSTVQDIDHKSLFLGWIQKQECLFAGHMEAINAEKLVLLFYNSWDSKTGYTKLVILGIGNKLYLSCKQKGGQPQLQLEKVETSLKKTLGKEMGRFLFKFQGTSSGCTFESVAHPGWFIATADANRQPVRLHNLIGQDFYTEFYLPELQTTSGL